MPDDFFVQNKTPYKKQGKQLVTICRFSLICYGQPVRFQKTQVKIFLIKKTSDYCADFLIADCNCGINSPLLGNSHRSMTTFPSGPINIKWGI